MTHTVSKRTRRWFLGRTALTAGSLSTIAGCLNTGPTPAEQVEKHRSDLERFKDVSTALSEGYQTSATYIQTDDGVLGIPFVNSQITEVKPTKPQAILYDLTETGKYEPLGLKWFVPAKKRDEPPTLFGKKFSGPIESQTGLIPRHYALHVWLFRENPNGLFARYNPAVDPAALVEKIKRTRDALQGFLLGNKAANAGYRNTEKCISTKRGAYGVPFIRKEADGSGGTALTEPPILFYRVTSNWRYVLMGAEWYVPADTTKNPPTLFGQPFHDPMAGHSPKTDQPNHYGLHAWLFRANPDGMFTLFNPTVHC